MNHYLIADLDRELWVYKGEQLFLEEWCPHLWVVCDELSDGKTNVIKTFYTKLGARLWLWRFGAKYDK